MAAPLRHAALSNHYHCHLPTVSLAVQWLPTVQIPYHETMGEKNIVKRKKKGGARYDPSWRFMARDV